MEQKKYVKTDEESDDSDGDVSKNKEEKLVPVVDEKPKILRENSGDPELLTSMNNVNLENREQILLDLLYGAGSSQSEDEEDIIECDE